MSHPVPSLEGTGAGCGCTFLAKSPAPMAQDGHTLLHAPSQQLTALCMSFFDFFSVSLTFYMAWMPVVPVNSLGCEAWRPAVYCSQGFWILQPGVKVKEKLVWPEESCSRNVRSQWPDVSKTAARLRWLKLDSPFWFRRVTVIELFRKVGGFLQCTFIV